MGIFVPELYKMFKNDKYSMDKLLQIINIASEHPIILLITVIALIVSAIVGTQLIIKRTSKGNIKQKQKAGKDSIQIQIGTFNKK